MPPTETVVDVPAVTDAPVVGDNGEACPAVSVSSFDLSQSLIHIFFFLDLKLILNENRPSQSMLQPLLQLQLLATMEKLVQLSR